MHQWALEFRLPAEVATEYRIQCRRTWIPHTMPQWASEYRVPCSSGQLNTVYLQQWALQYNEAVDTWIPFAMPQWAAAYRIACSSACVLCSAWITSQPGSSVRQAREGGKMLHGLKMMVFVFRKQSQFGPSPPPPPSTHYITPPPHPSCIKSIKPAICVGLSCLESQALQHAEFSLIFYRRRRGGERRGSVIFGVAFVQYIAK
jgi:hypothetical protein